MKVRAQRLVLGLGAIAPVDGVGLGEGGDLGHPIEQPGMLDVGGRAQAHAGHRGMVHR
jgi:hypothetical protein